MIWGYHYFWKHPFGVSGNLRAENPKNHGSNPAILEGFGCVFRRGLGCPNHQFWDAMILRVKIPNKIHQNSSLRVKQQYILEPLLVRYHTIQTIHHLEKETAFASKYQISTSVMPYFPEQWIRIQLAGSYDLYMTYSKWVPFPSFHNSPTQCKTTLVEQDEYSGPWQL